MRDAWSVMHGTAGRIDEMTGKVTAMLFGNDDGGEVKTFQQRLELMDISSADVRLELSAGELEVRGGAPGLADLDLRYTENLEPEMMHYVDNGRGTLRLRQKVQNLRLNRSESHWNITLNDTVPIDLRVEHRAGKSRLDLAAVTLSALVLDSDAGTSVIRAGGEQPHLSEVKVDSKAGKTELTLDGHYGRLHRVRLDSKAGHAVVNLRGRFDTDLDFRIDSTAGHVELLLPTDIGIEVEARTTVGHVSTRGLDRDGDTYRNRLFGASPVTLRVRVSAAVGKITLDAGA
jgi:hypothetical protein